MNQPPQDRPAARRRPGGAGPLGGEDGRLPGHVVPGRALGLRQVRRWSNWTAAVLVAATAVTTGYFAQASVGTAPAAVAIGAKGTATAAGTHQPCISVPVATSGGSAVTAPATIRSCGAGGPGTGTSGPAVIYVSRTGERQDS
jgi:hypothetical protein